ncbi:citrate-proton symporter [Salmonella enterica subsp. enterica]|nr:citrate-proton symporter [Salmonella enterica subsp. enterica]
MAQHTPATSRAGTFGAILRVTSGNFLEQFDFFLFGFYATYIAKTFFPAESEFASLMLTFAVFGSGFLMRPVGAIVLGAYIDRIGRRKGLMVTLAIMGCGTLLIALVPGYQTIGLAAPALVLLGRLLQGFSAGVELGGVSVYLSEIATPGNKGFYTSWQSASQQVAIVVAALIGYSLNITLGTRRDIGVGLANSVLYRLYDHSADFCFTSFITRNRSVFTTQASPRHQGNFCNYRQKLAHYYGRNAAGGDDHHNVLFYHRLYADLWQNRA